MNDEILYVFTCTDRVHDGRTFVQRDLIVSADGADGTAVRGAQYGAVGRSWALATHRVVG